MIPMMAPMTASSSLQVTGVQDAELAVLVVQRTESPTGMDRSDCAQDLDSKESCANTYDNLSQLQHLSQQKMQLKHDCHQAYDSHQACRQQVATKVCTAEGQLQLAEAELAEAERTSDSEPAIDSIGHRSEHAADVPEAPHEDVLQDMEHLDDAGFAGLPFDDDYIFLGLDMDDNLDMADDLVNFILPESVVAGVSPVRNGGPGSFIGDVPSSSHAHPQGLGCSQRSSHDGSVHMKMVEGDLPGKAKVRQAPESTRIAARASTAPTKPGQSSGSAAANSSKSSRAKTTSSKGKSKASGGKTRAVRHLTVADLTPAIKGAGLMLLWPEDGSWWDGIVLEFNEVTKAAVIFYGSTGQEENVDLAELVRTQEVAWPEARTVSDATAGAAGGRVGDKGGKVKMTAGVTMAGRKVSGKEIGTAARAATAVKPKQSVDSPVQQQPAPQYQSQRIRARMEAAAAAAESTVAAPTAAVEGAAGSMAQSIEGKPHRHPEEMWDTRPHKKMRSLNSLSTSSPAMPASIGDEAGSAMRASAQQGAAGSPCVPLHASSGGELPPTSMHGQAQALAGQQPVSQAMTPAQQYAMQQHYQMQQQQMAMQYYQRAQQPGISAMHMMHGYPGMMHGAGMYPAAHAGYGYGYGQPAMSMSHTSQSIPASSQAMTASAIHNARHGALVASATRQAMASAPGMSQAGYNATGAYALQGASAGYDAVGEYPAAGHMQMPQAADATDVLDRQAQQSLAPPVAQALQPMQQQQRQPVQGQQQQAVQQPAPPGQDPCVLRALIAAGGASAGRRIMVYYDVEKRWMHGTIAECVVNSHMQIRYDNGYYDQLTKDQVATIALL